jgi:excisionase family DNA binding protein
MEKICIVKRRQLYSEVKAVPAITEIRESSLKIENPAVDMEASGESFNGQPAVKELNNKSANEVSITLTPEQSKVLQETDYIKKMLNGTIKDPAFTIQRNAAGQIVLNYRFYVAVHLRMLRIDQVCTMLQISRSNLKRMIHGNKIKSYKIGRLRRFLLADILEYLLGN